MVLYIYIYVVDSNELVHYSTGFSKSQKMYPVENKQPREAFKLMALSIPYLDSWNVCTIENEVRVFAFWIKSFCLHFCDPICAMCDNKALIMWYKSFKMGNYLGMSWNVYHYSIAMQLNEISVYAYGNMGIIVYSVCGPSALDSLW